MMRFLLLGPVAILLAACAGLPGVSARPEAVSLGGERMSVRFTDGVVCRTAVPLTGGQGQLEGCAHPLDWAVTIHKRNYLEPVFGEAVSPYAHIVLSDGSGRNWAFQTPMPVDGDSRL